MQRAVAGVIPGIRVHRRLADLLILAGLLILPVFWFWPVAFGNKTLLPADNLFADQPWKSFAAQFGVTQPHNGLLSDLILENYPWKKFIVESIHAGQVPLWNPYLFGGAPFLASGQHSALYPFSVLFYILPLWRAYGLFTVWQLFLAGVFAYVLARVLGLGRPAAAIVAVSYQFCQFLMVSVVFPMFLAGAPWLPLILASIELVIRQRPLMGRPATIPWVALGAVGFGCQILAGHVELFYYTLLVAAAFAVWRLLTWDAPPSTIRRFGNAFLGWLFDRRRVLWAFAAIFGLGISLGAIQFVPLYELAQNNFRQGSATYEQIAGWSYPLRHIVALLIPNFYGNPAHHGYFDLFSGTWTPMDLNAAGQPNPNGPGTTAWGIKNYVEGGAYVGILPLLLAIIGILSIRARPDHRGTGQPSIARRLWDGICSYPQVPFFTLLAVVCLGFAFGTPLYRLIFWLPGINQLHSPFRWMWPFSLSIAVLAGFGVQHILDNQPGWVRRLGGLVVWAGLAELVALLLSRLLYGHLAGFVDQLFLRLAKAPEAFPNGRAFYSYELPWLLLLALLVLLSGLILRLAVHGNRRTSNGHSRFVSEIPLWVLLAVALIVVDLYAASGDFNPAADPALLDFQPPVVRFLKQDTGLWRLTAYTPVENGSPLTTKTMNANTAWIFDLADVRGYDSIISKQYTDYMGWIAPQGELQYNRVAPIYDASALNSPLLDVLGVKYVLSEQPIDNPKFQLVYNGEIRVYRNRDVQPRAFILPETQTLVTSDVGAALQKTDPRKAVLLEQDQVAGVGNSINTCFIRPSSASNPPLPPAPAQFTATVERDAGNDALVQAGGPQPGWLILADTAYPGWKAFMRPQGAPATAECETPILRADGNFRAVYLPAGAWTVRFVYSPLSFKLGAFVSFLAGVIILFLLGVWLWRFFVQAGSTDSNTRRVARNSLAPMILNLLNRLVDFAFAIVMLRLLGPGDAGKYYFAVVIVGWFEILTNFGLNTLLTREVARDRSQAGRYLIHTSLLRMALLAVAVPVLAGVLGVHNLVGGADESTNLAIVLLFIGQIPSSMSAGLTALFYAFEQAEFTAAWATVTTLLKVTLGLFALLAGWGFVGLAGVSIVVNLVTMSALALVAWQRFRPAGGWQVRAEAESTRASDLWRLPASWRTMLIESYPLMLNHLLATLFFKVDVTLLEPLKGPTVVGDYSAAYKFIDAYNIIPAYSTMALFPVLSRQAQDSRQAMMRTYRLVLKLLVIIALGLAVLTTYLAPLLVLILGGTAFLPDGAIALQLMVWSIPIGWINSVTNYVLIALGQQRSQSWAFAVGLAFNIVANLLFIPLYSYKAAAVITLLSEVVLLVCFYIYLRRSLGPIPWIELLWRPVVAAGLMAATLYSLAPRSPVLALFAAVVVYVVALLVLGVLGPEERAVIVELMPRRFGAALSGRLAGGG